MCRTAWCPSVPHPALLIMSQRQNRIWCLKQHRHDNVKRGTVWNSQLRGSHDIGSWILPSKYIYFESQEILPHLKKWILKIYRNSSLWIRQERQRLMNRGLSFTIQIILIKMKQNRQFKLITVDLFWGGIKQSYWCPWKLYLLLDNKNYYSQTKHPACIVFANFKAELNEWCHIYGLPPGIISQEMTTASCHNTSNAVLGGPEVTSQTPAPSPTYSSW